MSGLISTWKEQKERTRDAPPRPHLPPAGTHPMVEHVRPLGGLGNDGGDARHCLRRPRLCLLHPPSNTTNDCTK